MTPKRCVGEGRSSLCTRPLSELSSVLGRIFSVRLDVPEFDEGALYEKKVKEFCVGLLDNPVNHTWWQSVRGLELDQRTSISASLFLARKALAFSPDPHQAEKHAALLGSPAPAPKQDYIQFVEKEIDKLFPIGWDGAYQRHVYSHTPSSSSCLEYPRRKGGAARWLAEQGRDWFADACLGIAPVPLENPVRFSVVPTGGKRRGVTVASAMFHLLGPLHRTLYDHLSQFEWCLRGEARGKKFRKFQEVKGEVFVSGDYESATDNLSLEVTEVILRRVLSRARRVPDSIRALAFRSLRASIHYPGGRQVEQLRGQLMGNFLSFPLLCLQNYLSFKFLIPRPVPVRINGDDIVFRCTRPEFDRWADGVKSCGLTLCKGKTLVHSRIFSLNSSFFKAGNRRVWEIPVIRLHSVYSLSEYPLAGNGFTKFIRGWTGEARRLLGGLWLSHRRPQIQATGRSVWKLGIPADNSQLHTAGLAVREAFLRGGFGQSESPLPQPPAATSRSEEWVKIPRYCVRVTLSQEIAWQKEFREWAGSAAWKPRNSDQTNDLWNEWWKTVMTAGREPQWLSWKRTTRRVHKMGYKSLNLRLGAPPPRERVKTMWIPAYLLVQGSRLRNRGVGAR